MKKPVAETHFVVGTSDIVGSQFKFVGLHDVLLRNGLNFIAAYVGSCWADVGPLLGWCWALIEPYWVYFGSFGAVLGPFLFVLKKL